MQPAAPPSFDPDGPLPREFAAIMRPELPGLIKEIRSEVTRTYPEYNTLLSGPDGDMIRRGVEASLQAFVDRVADPACATAQRDELLRKFGRIEAYEGRGLASLQGAYKLGARVALRRAKAVGRRYKLSPNVLLSFADALFAYVGELESLSREGHDEVSAGAGAESSALRRQLLHMLLVGPPLPEAGIRELCEQTAWDMPDEVTLVAVRAPAPDTTRRALAADCLADLGIPQPHILVPGPFTPARRRMLQEALADTPAVIGLTVPTAHGSDSIRWARHALRLVDEGIIPERPLIDCADHLTTLWLLSDPQLTAHIAAAELAPLDSVSGHRRERLVETLRVHITTRAPAEQVGEALGVHAQTVRYRLRNLDSYFGEQLTDPDHRFALETALRAQHLLGARSAEETDGGGEAGGRAEGGEGNDVSAGADGARA
ncbi:PucR family transcriptional regulator [Streptomyces sp. KLOTTS4A1]|uniref:PucR family transcriptional regulator n=1 Tax=Streptomyces sp. KLOTTS4A1 TaxID=3390996 RepID=UPI0039F61A4C